MSWAITVLCLFLLLAPLAVLYDLTTKRIPSRIQGDKAPRSRFGLVAVDGFGSRLNANGFDIIFVHGLGSNPDTTWRARKTPARGAHDSHIAEEGVCWVTDLLPEDIPSSSRQCSRVFFYNHDSYWQRDAVQTRLWNLSHDLLHHLSSEIRKSPEVGLERGRGLIFVGHSYGGLLVKQALVQATRNPSFEEIAKQTRAVLFLGTPHSGSTFTNWGTVIAKALEPLGSNASILNEIAYDSASLLDLHREFMSVVGGNIRVVNFFEQRKTCIFRLWFLQWNEFCVREGSATYASAPKNVQNIGLGVDHYGLNKFGSKTREYRIILSKLIELLGPTPQLWHSVPLKTVASYTARGGLSSLIEEKLRVSFDNSDLPHALVIHGLGGAGKTQLTLKYIEDHREKYSPILWVDAQSVDAVRASFERCANILQLPVDKTPTQESALKDSLTIKSVLCWLGQSKSEWLVVIDNADDPSWDVEEIIPRGERGTVIITSQHAQAPQLLNKQCGRIQVYMMEPSEASILLLKHLGWKYGSASNAVREVCKEIVDRLGGLALAVELAGAYLGEQSDQEAALKRYLIDYDRHQDDLFQYGSFYKLSSYEKTVWTVWETSLAAIETRYPEMPAGLVLAFLAQFDRGNAQEELFRLASLGLPRIWGYLCSRGHSLPDWLKKLVVVDGQEWDSFHYRRALDPLIRYSLLQRVEGEWPGVTMHGLVQWRAKKHQPDQPWDLWVSIFVCAVCRQIQEERGRPQFRRYMIPHISAMRSSGFNESTSASELEEQMNGLVWSYIGRIYYEEGQWKEAEELLLRATETKTRTRGKEHPETLISMSYLANTYRKQGRWKEAEELFLREIEMRTERQGKECPETLTSMSDLALTYQRQGRWKEAEELFLREMETRTKLQGKEHPHTLTSIHNLASTYRKQGRWKEAEKLQVEVVEISIRVLGKEHPDTLSSMGDLAKTYRTQGQWSEAEKLFRREMETRMRIQGKEHPDTLTSMGDLAVTYRKQGRLKEAEGLLLQELETRTRLQGKEYPNTLTSMGDLAVTYQKQGRWKEAEELQVQELEIRTRTHGKKHPETLTSKANLAYTWKLQGRETDAIGLLRETQQLQRDILGSDHPYTRRSATTLFKWESKNRTVESATTL